jgi:hypothetical protein
MAACERAIYGLKPFKKNLVTIRSGICERYNNQVLSPPKILIFTRESLCMAVRVLLHIHTDKSRTLQLRILSRCVSWMDAHVTEMT